MGSFSSLPELRGNSKAIQNGGVSRLLDSPRIHFMNSGNDGGDRW